MAKAWLAGLVCLFVALSGALTGCAKQQGEGASNEAPVEGITQAPGTPDNPDLEPAPPATPNTITVGVRYVALKASAGDAESPTRAQVETLLANMSNVWAQCDIRFVLADYLSPVASDVGVAYNPANHSQLDTARSRFDDGTAALIVKTGTWNRSGNLGADGSNGFSTLPPSDPDGIVLESGVATSTLLTAHEIGHLIGALGHSSSSTNLMNHFITSSTTLLSSSQCTTARNTINNQVAAWKR